ncbi:MULTISPECIES: DUF2325 domain-containing protein [unclassified Methylobacterium]|jgi:hypothetical protein|uniref:DUF2325 domain-containing protein n=1 Tax=unclassified Methylobacterium TaxID=2615210 RepID=UPI0036FD7758
MPDCPSRHRGHAVSRNALAAVSLADTGSGILPDLLGRFLEPFFTTKEVGKGTGLGLSQVFGFARQSGGDIRVASTVGEGTTFTLYPPEGEQEAVPARVRGPDGGVTPLGTGQRILVVEGNIGAGQFATQILEVEARLAREAAHAEALEERLAVLSHATKRLSVDLAAEIARRTAAEAELASLEAALEGADHDEGVDPAHGRIEGRIFLYVGGRPRQVRNLRRFIDQRGGRLLSHDGGIDDNLALLPGLVGQADCAVFPVSCISHEASLLLKRHCEALTKPFRPVRSASLASFVHVLEQQERTAGL